MNTVPNTDRTQIAFNTFWKIAERMVMEEAEKAETKQKQNVDKNDCNLKDKD